MDGLLQKGEIYTLQPLEHPSSIHYQKFTKANFHPLASQLSPPMSPQQNFCNSWPYYPCICQWNQMICQRHDWLSIPLGPTLTFHRNIYTCDFWCLLSVYQYSPTKKALQLWPGLYLTKEIQPSPTDQLVRLLLKNVFEMNNFEFCNEHFLQVGETTMGMRVAPLYANLFMSDLEDKFTPGTNNL